MDDLVGALMNLVFIFLERHIQWFLGLLFLLGFGTLIFAACNVESQVQIDERLDVIEVYPQMEAVTRNPAVCTETVTYYVPPNHGVRCKKGTITAVAITRQKYVSLTCTCN